MKRVKSNWSDVILVCRKCSKKLDGGFWPDADQTLAKVLRKEIAREAGVDGKKAKGRRATMGVIEVGCFDICPKGEVITVRASAAKEWLVTPRGTPAPVVLARLGLAVQPAPSSANISPISSSSSSRHAPG